MPKSKSGRTHGKKRKEAPGPFTAAGLVRFYEEADVGIKIKPQVLVILALAFSIAMIVLSKIM
ncbi:MAG: preprotein translocase subunit Sec61beta [Staphylothermus sp.]|nr:preprotein translocase subunit Sec61beta [Staphylothermus sp.]